MDATIAQPRLLDILDNYVITHFRKTNMEGINWYSIGVVKKETWKTGIYGIHFEAEVYKGTSLGALFRNILTPREKTATA